MFQRVNEQVVSHCMVRFVCCTCTELLFNVEVKIYCEFMFTRRRCLDDSQILLVFSAADFVWHIALLEQTASIIALFVSCFSHLWWIKFHVLFSGWLIAYQPSHPERRTQSPARNMVRNSFDASINLQDQETARILMQKYCFNFCEKCFSCFIEESCSIVTFKWTLLTISLKQQ